MTKTLIAVGLGVIVGCLLPSVPNACALQALQGRTEERFAEAQAELGVQAELEALRMRAQFHETRLRALEAKCCCRNRCCPR